MIREVEIVLGEVGGSVDVGGIDRGYPLTLLFRLFLGLLQSEFIFKRFLFLS